MATVVFDFDSVLVPCESLEVVLARSEGLSDEDLAAIEDLTRQGMEGQIPFAESLARRLAIARPDVGTLMAFGWHLAERPTVGARDLIRHLDEAGHHVWIVSGGFQELLESVGTRLGVPAERIQGVRARWDDDGLFLGLDEACGFCRSKVEGLRDLAPTLPGPVIGVGDGATDLALRTAGLVDHFVAYTEHARREAVVAGADAEASSMASLGEVLATLLP
ncbi:MAG: HAD-IB family phosphatase [Planctomycetota bacterium]|nr:HAD-IB family phosphatase [Planctomycetota bacterium]